MGPSTTFDAIDNSRDATKGNKVKAPASPRQKRMNRSRAVPLPIEDAIARIRSMIPLLRQETENAIRLQASLESANDVVQRELRGRQFYGADCFNDVKLATQLYLSITLAKLFELPKPRSRQSAAKKLNSSDVVSLPLLLRLIGQKRCTRHLVGRARSWHPVMGDTNVNACEKAILGALAPYGRLRGSPQGIAALAKVRAFRNSFLAHTLLTRDEKSIPTYSELRLLTDAARDILQDAEFAVTGVHHFMADWEAERQRIARAFWIPALRAAAFAPPFREKR